MALSFIPYFCFTWSWDLYAQNLIDLLNTHLWNLFTTLLNLPSTLVVKETTILTPVLLQKQWSRLQLQTAQTAMNF